MQNNSSTVGPFEIKISVHHHDIDLMGHVNNVVYLKWVQDAAVAHWQSEATTDQQEKILWVVKRHEIDYKMAAREGDELILRTWVGNSTEIVFERYTEILRAADRKLLAQAKTLWVPVNSKTLRPLRVDEDVRKRFSTG